MEQISLSKAEFEAITTLASGDIAIVGLKRKKFDGADWYQLEWISEGEGGNWNIDVKKITLLPTSSELKAKDMEFGSSLLLDFFSQTKDIALDNATYRQVSEMFHYAEIALRRGDIPQAKTELTAIAVVDPVWTQQAKDYFIGKIDSYLGA